MNPNADNARKVGKHSRVDNAWWYGTSNFTADQFSSRRHCDAL